jgi:hypothetical protein
MISISTVITINLSWIYIWKVSTAEMTEASANITLNFLHYKKITLALSRMPEPFLS